MFLLSWLLVKFTTLRAASGKIEQTSHDISVLENINAIGIGMNFL